MLRWMMPILAFGISSFAANIVVDGDISDWARVAPGFKKRQADAPIRAISVTADREHIFVRLEFAKPEGLLAVPGTLTLLADSDDNPKTGMFREGLPGVDISLEFSVHKCSVTVFTQVDPAEVKCGDQNLRLTMAPSFAAKYVELAVTRFGVVGTRSNLFSSRQARWKMLFRDNNRTVQEGQFVSTVPGHDHPPVLTGEGNPLKRASGTDFRVVTWNVANRYWNQNPEPYRRVLRALQPDVVVLIEVLDQTNQEWIQSFFGSLGPQLGGWHFLVGKTGGWDRCLVASKLPVTRVFDEVRHRDETIQRLGPLMDGLVANSAAPKKTTKDGITSAAAYIEIGGRKLLTTAVHLDCCDNRAGSPAHQRREAEASAVAEKLKDAIGSHYVDAVITTGDFNLVSTRRALDILREGLDRKRGNLTEAAAVGLNGWATATYVPTPRTPFPRSKLDYVLYGSSSLSLRRAFVFDSVELAPEWLAQYGMTAADSGASDHLPVVADFAWQK